MNSTGQTFSPLGQKIMPLFNFVIQTPGSYTLSAVYQNETSGPTVPVIVFPQSIQNVKQTIFVGVSFFILFLVFGIVILVKLNKWAPSSPGTPSQKKV